MGRGDGGIGRAGRLMESWQIQREMVGMKMGFAGVLPGRGSQGAKDSLVRDWGLY